MTPEDFFERLKQIFPQQNEGSPNEGSPNETSPNETSSHIIAKPKKQYISFNDILSIFGISKDVYNNLLVRRNKYI